MDMEVACLEASFLAPDLHGAKAELLYISGDEENERKSLLHQTQVYDQMLMDTESKLHTSSHNSKSQGEPGSVEYNHALEAHPLVKAAPPPDRITPTYFSIFFST